jgi:SAM-dependent methyltransferase
MAKILVIGAGANWQEHKKQLKNKNPGNEYIGIDILISFTPDIVRDINRGLPFNDNEFEEVWCSHVLEHISGMLPCEPKDNFNFVMNEIHRVLKPNGVATIEVPYWRDDIAVEAAGHIRLFAENSFINYYSNPYAKEMGQPHFELVSKEIVDSQRSGETPARCLIVNLKK